MQFLDKWERKLGWMSFPGLFRYYALIHIMVFLLRILNPEIGTELDFDLQKILSGEVWRVATFLFASNGLEGWSLGISALFLYFMAMIAFMVSDGLEASWGVFRTSLFIYAGIAGLLIANVAFSLLFYNAFNVMISVPFTGLLLYSSAFFAFATLFPRVELMVFLVLPVQVRWLAILAAIPIVKLVFTLPISIPYLLLGFGNYLLWAGIPALRGQGRVIKSAGRRKKFKEAKLSDEDSFHRCKKCGRTEISDPDLEFRMAEDGEEYCGDHLPG
jgi:hypothetical protein